MKFYKSSLIESMISQNLITIDVNPSYLSKNPTTSTTQLPLNHYEKKLLLLSPDPRYTAVLDRHPCYLACNCGFNHVQTVQCTHDVIHRALIWHLSRVLLQNFAFIICNISRIWHHRIGAFPSARRFYRASNVWITS